MRGHARPPARRKCLQLLRSLNWCGDYRLISRATSDLRKEITFITILSDVHCGEEIVTISTARQMRLQGEHLAKSPGQPDFFDQFNRGALPKLDFIMGVGDPSRIPTAVRALQQILAEKGNGYDVRNIVLANFGLTVDQVRDIQRSLNHTVTVQEAARHSAAHSFNEGAKRAAKFDGPADFSVKLDDDSRMGSGGMRTMVDGVIGNKLAVAAPVNVRTGADYSNDAEFAEVERAHRMSGKVVYSAHLTESGKLDLARLLMGFITTHCDGDVPATTNENGLFLSAPLVRDLLESPANVVFSEARGGSEGLRLAAVMAQGPYANQIGVVKTPVFDRQADNTAQPISFGRTDAELVALLEQSGLMPQGIQFAGWNPDGRLFHGDVEHQEPIVIKDLVRFSWYASEIARWQENGLATSFPEEQRTYFPDFSARIQEVEEVAARATLDRPRTYYGFLDPSLPHLQRDHNNLVNGTAHMLGSFIRSQELGMKMNIFHSW